MALDLSSLDELTTTQAAPVAPGKPMMVRVADIDRDPAQPRVEFDPEAMAELQASIRERGVKSPVSLKPNPDGSGRWLINDGERRWLASKGEGLEEIPAFVDEGHDDYDQVIANLQRESLTPVELARFIARKVRDGEKPAQIARALGKGKSFVSEHLALADLPSCIAEVYADGRTRSYKTLYELTKLYEKFPDQVEVWCAENTEVSRRAVQDLADALLNDASPRVSIDLTPGEQTLDPEHSWKEPTGIDIASDEAEAGSLSGEDDTGDAEWLGSMGSDGEEGEKGQGSEPVQHLPFHNPEHEKEKREPKLADPTRIKKPVLLVEFDDRCAMLMINRRPTTPGLVHIKFEDNGDEIEVDAGKLKINCLIEQTGRVRFFVCGAVKLLSATGVPA